MRVAVCYYGLLRSYDKVEKTHDTHIFDVLRKHNIEFDVFAHTWKIHQTKNYHAPHDLSGVEIQNKNIALLLTKNIQVLEITDQDHYYSQFGKNLYNLKPYNPALQKSRTIPEACAHYRIRSSIFESYIAQLSGHRDMPLIIYEYNNTQYVVSDENFNQYIRMICGLESLKRSVQLSYQNNKVYDYYLIIRPDVLVYEDIDIHSLLSLSNDTILLMDEKSYNGYNDRAAICPSRLVQTFAYRVDRILEYRKYRMENLDTYNVFATDYPEDYLKYCLDSAHVNVKKHDFLKFDILRSNNKIVHT